MADYYEILKVPRTATTAEIRKAYALVARDHHPDRFTDPEQKARAQDFFKDATAAFNTLSSERARREYDAEISKPKATTPAELAAEAFAQAQRATSAEAAAELLRQAAYHAPQEARYHAALGRVLAQDPKRSREAVEALEQATRLDPRDARCLVDLARLLRGVGLTVRARKAAEAAVAAAPGDADVARLLAELLPPAPDPGPPGGLLGLLRKKP